jgi:hypothetical protein
LTLAEREDISRGIAAGESGRAIAERLGRAASTLCREIGRYGGRDAYRAGKADAGAWEAALLGHSDVSATMIYTHVLASSAGGTPSPLESLPDVNSVREVSPQYGSRHQLIAAAGGRFDYGSLRPPMNR